MIIFQYGAFVPYRIYCDGLFPDIFAQFHKTGIITADQDITKMNRRNRYVGFMENLDFSTKRSGHRREMG